MRDCNTLLTAYQAHMGLMEQFKSVITTEDYQRGAMLQALHELETDYPKSAKITLMAALRDQDLNQGPLADSMMRAVNWIDLKQSDKAEEELRTTLLTCTQQPNQN